MKVTIDYRQVRYWQKPPLAFKVPAMSNPVESAGWVSETQWDALLLHLKREGVSPETFCSHFSISDVGKLQAEDFPAALIFIGKNSKERSCVSIV